jgi:hypothetical protein
VRERNLIPPLDSDGLCIECGHQPDTCDCAVRLSATCSRCGHLHEYHVRDNRDRPFCFGTPVCDCQASGIPAAQREEYDPSPLPIERRLA